MTDSRSPAELVRRVLAAFECADVEPLLAVVDENIVWKSAFGKNLGLRFGGEYHGRAGALEVLSQLAMSVVFARFHPREIMSEGEVVWCLVDAEIAPASTPHRPIRCDAAVRCRVRGGRIVEVQNFFDTATLRDHLLAGMRPRKSESVS